MGVLASADNPVSHGASGFCRWKKLLYYAKKNTAAEYICGCVLCSVAYCCVDWIWRDNISPDLTWVSYLPSLWQFALQIWGVSGLTLNMAFSIYLPYRFSAIYFSAM